MKKTIYSLTMAAACLMGMSSCNDWLDILPNNEQVTDEYWKSKDDVEAVVASGYYYMRSAVPNTLLWGELRGGVFYSPTTNFAKLQNFDMNAENSLCNYSNYYKVISMANSVLKYAPGVADIDATYYKSLLNSHLCEAYFQRAFSYMILMKNFKEVPLITEPYVNDDMSFDVEKSSEAEIIAQIKADVQAALATGAAKGVYDDDWETKGRATKWALYALMADVCLWNHDYDECIDYSNKILEATDAFRPVFISSPNDWFTIFYPGNSNESIFELNWDYSTYGEKNNFASYFSMAAGSTLSFTPSAQELLLQETMALDPNGSETGRIGRTYLGSYASSTAYKGASFYYVWKYRGTDVVDLNNVRTSDDANFILYRVADVMLMKAEALVMKGTTSFAEAVSLINQIRVRAGGVIYADASNADLIADLDESTLLEEILKQRELEFIAEGKRWYDVLRLARYDNGSNGYKEKAMNLILEGNTTISAKLIQTALKDDYAWYIPLPQSDIESNKLLVQNPYYTSK